MFNLTAADSKRASTRGSAAMKATYYIDGKPCAAEDVMKRIGWTKAEAVASIRRERDAGRTPLTWAALEASAARQRARK